MCGSGHTFVTLEPFSIVAHAVAECAFVTAQLPVSGLELRALYELACLCS